MPGSMPDVPVAGPQRRWAAELLYVWCHKLRPRDWFGPDPAVDAMLRRRFGRELSSLRRRPASEFLTDPLTALAAVLLFDQLPRNLHRGTPQAFATDPLARAIAKGALARGWDAALTLPQRQFLAMPLMHSEAIADQRLSLAVFARLGPRYGWPFARSHYRMIARFGRFPHRNPVLGRPSKPAEIAAVEAGNRW
jgi:uncharacterized protein (DUF924 family)